MVSLKRDIGGFCLKNNSSPARIRPVFPALGDKLKDEGIMLKKVVIEFKELHN